MRRSYWLAFGVGLGIAAVGVAQQPAAPAVPAPQSPPGPVAPWANKFFLPDAAANREQAAPPVVAHDFGAVPHGTLCSHTFAVTNIYDVPMQITEVRKSCTCLDFVPLSKVLEPNESGAFTVTMNTGKFVGANSQTFYVTVGPKFVSTAVIRVSANSQTEVTVSPGAVQFGTVAPGSKPSQGVKVEYKGRKAWKITEVVAPPATLDVQLTETGRGGPLRGGVEYLVTVALKPTPQAGPISEQITLKTNDPSNPVIQLAVTGTVSAPLEIAPGRVRLDGVAVGESAAQRVLIRAAKPFRVVAVDGSGDGVSAELPSSGAALPLQVITVKFDPTKAGAVARDLRVRTDLDGGASVALPVEAEAVAK